MQSGTRHEQLLLGCSSGASHLLVWQLHCLQCLVSKDGQRETRVAQGEERERERDESLGTMTNLKIGDVKVFVCGKTLWAWYRDSSIVPLFVSAWFDHI